MLWFEDVFGFKELDYKDTNAKFHVKNSKLMASGAVMREFHAGEFSTPMLQELRKQGMNILQQTKGQSSVNLFHIATSSVLNMHHEHPGAVFQAASQFNCLEFPSPSHTPEHGITSYVCDNTQGPACALACPAGTVFRNYFAPCGKNQIGQTSDCQVNLLNEFEAAIKNKKHNYFTIENGYTFGVSVAKFNGLNHKIKNYHDELMSVVKVGVQADTDVVLKGLFEVIPAHERPRVTQVYCAAPSINYARQFALTEYWEPLAKLLLQGMYEATLWTGVINGVKTGNYDVFLTSVGAGVFGNKIEWVDEAIIRAVKILSRAGARLNVYLCHYRSTDGLRIKRIAKALQ